MKDVPRRGWLAIGLTLLSGIYSVLLLVWVTLIPDSSNGGQTLLEFGGSAIGTFLIFGQPLVLTAIFWVLLHRYCTTGSETAGKVAHMATPLYFAWSVLAGFTVAAGALPAALLLTLAAWFTPRGTPAAT